ncbi:uromodulin-like isoform X1 [Montipora foliosa]|uniref:uromodulin-like isoform X1 n=1 Tax=Montipora foliosa TaxID=591990 RepID=UPI0035F1E710
MKVSITFITLLSLFHFQWLNATFHTAEFEFRAFHHLNVTRPLVDIFVDGYLDCSFACLQNMLCISFNVAASPDDKGKFRCELLPSTSSNNPANLTADPHSHLYQIKSPCVKEPCYNKGTCSPISYRDGTYRCTCHPGYLGRFCETAPPECASYTVLNGTKRHHMNDAGFSYSDHNLIKSWYRFQGNGYTRMVDRCISYYHFGGRTPGWLKGGHPSLADGIVQRTACFHIRNNCCNYRRAIRVRNCGDYYVYELRATRSSGHVYCTTS